MKEVDTIPLRTTPRRHRIPSDEWKQLCNGSLWQLDVADARRWRYRNTKVMAAAIKGRFRREGTPYTAVMRGAIVYVQANPEEQP